MKTVFETAKTKMNKTIHALQTEYGAIRAGRANPQILDKITVDYVKEKFTVKHRKGTIKTEE